MILPQKSSIAFTGEKIALLKLEQAQEKIPRFIKKAPYSYINLAVCKESV